MTELECFQYMEGQGSDISFCNMETEHLILIFLHKYLSRELYLPPCCIHAYKIYWIRLHREINKALSARLHRENLALNTIFGEMTNAFHIYDHGSNIGMSQRETFQYLQMIQEDLKGKKFKVLKYWKK
jgi:hypothetical protein